MADAVEEKPQELIIKKIIKGGAGHHGGAWKVAYADFVTAMMAFFLLLWLLSTTTPEQRNGIAEYFTPTTGIRDAKGIGFQGGMTPNEVGTSKTTLSPPGLVSGQVEQGPIPKPPVPVETVASSESGTPTESEVDEENTQEETQQKANKGEDTNEQQFKQIQEEIMNAFEQTPEVKQLKNNIIITNTPEGLKVDLVDDDTHTMFTPGSAVLTDDGRAMLKTVGSVVLRTTNRLSVTSHTESVQYPPGATYTAWELTADRSNASRRFLISNVVEPERIQKVAGMSDRELILPKEPAAARNRRVSIVLLRNSHIMNKASQPSGKGLLSTPKLNASELVKQKVVIPPPSAEASEKKSSGMLTDVSSSGAAASAPSEPVKPVTREMLSTPSINAKELREAKEKEKAAAVEVKEEEPEQKPSGMMIDVTSSGNAAPASSEPARPVTREILSTPTISTRELRESKKKEEAAETEAKEEAPEDSGMMGDVPTPGKPKEEPETPAP